MSKQDILQNKRNSVGKGLILLLLGAFFLLRNMDLDIPVWMVSWQMIPIGIGLILLVTSNFKNNAGFILIFIGGLFLMKDIYAWPFDVSRFIWPTAMIVAGLFIIFRKQGERKSSDSDYRKSEKYNAFSYNAGSSDDYFNIYAMFSGVNRIVVSKNFKGGKASAVFGGSDINLTQADFTGTVEIEAYCLCGGVEIVVPSNWKVKVEMNTIFGGVEDKRPIELLTDNLDKLLIIKGSCIFGGVEIKSYN
ncbi:Cell wall-active antibiotics response 4TMS YvqF [Chitinophaga sp. CF118]|uniref:LiaF transmembrane domain-containing protein n=1 Tax=Chitinophaga sp. CF118 TaxID=1884367 RepID=UPI0008EA30C7|nr:DUF5668 domain-containing protein [Chitinophaga sp. CF118]SFD05953.1 Cell wall-active antibiotics response 4TMS YvqF [Chitinophaga sp. CF118]